MVFLFFICAHNHDHSFFSIGMNPNATLVSLSWLGEIGGEVVCLLPFFSPSILPHFRTESRLNKSKQLLSDDSNDMLIAMGSVYTVCRG